MTPAWALASALWLGVLTAVCPCPLATNIAAISFLARKVGRPRAALLAGLLYAAGQAVAYAGLGSILVAGMTASVDARLFLQKYVSRLLGPLLVLAGMAILGLLGSRISISLAGMGVQERARKGGAIWALALGVLLALSFCPGTAVLFFSSSGLLPLATSQGSWFLLPLAYGLGAGAPVAAIAVLAAYAAQAMGKAFNRLRQFERGARAITGIIFILVGVYYCLTYIFGVSLSPG